MKYLMLSSINILEYYFSNLYTLLVFSLWLYFITTYTIFDLNKEMQLFVFNT